MLSLILAFALATAPCDKTDNECLLRLTLQQTYVAEAMKQENDLLQQRLKDAEANSQSGAKYFIAGGVVFTIFFGLSFTLMKHLGK